MSAVFARTADALITPSPTLEPIERLELYHRQYWYRLLDSIAEDFPGLRFLLGEGSFWRLIEAYLEATPPASFTLRHLGRSLPHFIEQHPRLARRPVHATDMARLEYAMMEAFEAGECPPLAPDALDRDRIFLQPHVRLLALRTPEDRIRQRAGEGKPPPRLAPAARRPNRFAAVYRQSFEVRVEGIPRAAHAILTSLRETASLDQTMDRVADDHSLAADADPARIRRWFRSWVSRGWLAADEPNVRPHETERREK